MHEVHCSPVQEIVGVLKGGHTGTIPRAVLLNSPTVEMMERSGASWPEAHRKAEDMARLAAEIHRSTGFHAVNLPWDACVELEALGGGSDTGTLPTSIPAAIEPAFRNTEDVEIPPDIFDRGRFPVVLEAVGRTKKMVGDDAAVVPLVEGPLNISCQAIGVNRMYRMFIRDPAAVARILDIFADLCVRYAAKLLEAGGDVIQLSDPFTQGLTAPRFKEMMIPAYRKISSGVKGPVFLHICGNTGHLLEHLPESGLSAFSFDSPCVTAAQVKAAIGSQMRVIGSVPTVTHILEGSEQDVFDASIKCMEDGVDILSPSCGLPPEAPLPNLRAMVRAIESYNERLGIT